MSVKSFTELEETISFYTRNDFAILNYLLVGNMERLWKSAVLAYNDNKGILKEYEDGVRTVSTDYDEKWIEILRHRIIGDLDPTTKEKVLQTAKNDIANILTAMKPSESERILYRTAWISPKDENPHAYPYAPQYRALPFKPDDILDIKIISSTSVIPYMEDCEIDCDFYRYEITVPENAFILELDQFECHNEEGEILLPPMKCKVKNIRNSTNKQCRGIIELEYLERSSLSV